MQNSPVSPGPQSPPTKLANVGRMAGAVGLVLCLSAPLTFILTLQMGLLVWGKVAVGAALIALYLMTNRGFFARLAGSRSLGLMTLSATSGAAVLGLVVALNVAIVRHPWERDMTAEGLYTLSPQTHQVVSQLAHDVHIYGFYASYEQAYPLVNDMLNRYQHLGTRLTYELIDPQARPDLTERFSITDRGPRLVITAQNQDARAKDVVEQDITNAIIKVAEPTCQRVYTLTGHAELDTDDPKLTEGARQFLDAIGSEGYQTAALELRRQAAGAAPTRVDLQNSQDTQDTPGLQVPQDAAAVLILGAMHPLLAPEVVALRTYLDAGGRLMVFYEPHVKTGLEALLKAWHIDVRDDFIVDTNPLNRLLGLGAAAPMVQPEHNDHPIVQNLTAAVVMSTVRSLAVAHEGPGRLENVAATALAHTADTAWGETKVSKDGTAQKDPEDFVPPLYVAAAAEKLWPNAPAAAEDTDAIATSRRSGATRIVVFGDSDFVSNKYLSMQGNSDFALNALNWLTEQDRKITIRPKNRAASQLFLSGSQMNIIKFICMDILPVLIIAAGLGITLVRRQR